MPVFWTRACNQPFLDKASKAFTSAEMISPGLLQPQLLTDFIVNQFYYAYQNLECHKISNLECKINNSPSQLGLSCRTGLGKQINMLCFNIQVQFWSLTWLRIGCLLWTGLWKVNIDIKIKQFQKKTMHVRYELRCKMVSLRKHNNIGV